LDTLLGNRSDTLLGNQLGMLLDMSGLLLELFQHNIADTRPDHRRSVHRPCRSLVHIGCRYTVPEDSGGSSTFLAVGLCMVLRGRLVEQPSLTGQV